MASKLSEGHEIDEDEPTALAFTPYNIEYEYDDDEDELSWDDLLKNNDWSDEEWNKAMMDDLEDEEWDDEDATDRVLNHMVNEIENEIPREEEVGESEEERKARSVKATTPRPTGKTRSVSSYK
jgi:hypothetical protein